MGKTVTFVHFRKTCIFSIIYQPDYLCDGAEGKGDIFILINTLSNTYYVDMTLKLKYSLNIIYLFDSLLWKSFTMVRVFLLLLLRNIDRLGLTKLVHYKIFV